MHALNIHRDSKTRDFKNRKRAVLETRSMRKSMPSATADILQCRKGLQFAGKEQPSRRKLEPRKIAMLSTLPATPEHTPSRNLPHMNHGSSRYYNPDVIDSKEQLLTE